MSAIGLAALAVTVGGCGGGDKTLSSKEYAAAITQICASNAERLQTLVAASGTNFLARKGDEFVAIAGKNITKIKNLRPPPELEDKAHQLVTQAEATRDRLIVLIRAAKKHPGSADLGDTKLIDSRRRMLDTAAAVGASC